jgi:AcrR family transcriptional regulator
MNEADRREALSPERIEAAALALLSRRGPDGFSIRKLAAELGCTAMSLYHYYPSKGHLLDAVVDRVAGEMMPDPPGSAPWRERLRRALIRWHATAVAKPGCYVFLATHRMNTPKALEWLEAVLALVREGTASDEEAARLFRALGHYVMGAGLDETAGYARGPSTVTPVPPDAMARDFPMVLAAAPYFAPAAREATFLRGIDAIIDGWMAGGGVSATDGERGRNPSAD